MSSMAKPQEREVRFDIYCELCKYERRLEKEPPCCDCLDEPVNIDSEKPVYFEKKEKQND